MHSKIRDLLQAANKEQIALAVTLCQSQGYMHILREYTQLLDWLYRSVGQHSAVAKLIRLKINHQPQVEQLYFMLHLHQISLKGAPITLPANLYYFLNLRKIEINTATLSIPDDITWPASLQEIIYFDQQSKSYPPLLTGCKTICRWTSSGLDHVIIKQLIQHYPNLKALQLFFNPSIKQLPADLGLLTQLEDLSILVQSVQSDRISAVPVSKLADSLQQFKQLQVLRLENLKFDHCVHLLSAMTQLKELELINVGLKTIPAQIQALQHLESLDLRYNHLNNPYVLPNWLKQMPALKTIRMYD